MANKNNNSWKKWGLLALALILGGLMTWNRVRAPKNPQVLSEQTEVQASPAPVADAPVQGEDDQEGGFIASVGQLVTNLISCVGPDGLTAQATKKDCDNLWDFWNNHSPAPYGGDPSTSSAPMGGQAGQAGGGSSATPTPAPQPEADPVIDEVNVYGCEVESCATVTAVEVIGENFDDNARIEVIGQDDGLGYEGILTGNNGSTYLLTDFYDLPCQWYGVRVYFTTDGREVWWDDEFLPWYCE